VFPLRPLRCLADNPRREGFDKNRDASVSREFILSGIGFRVAGNRSCARNFSGQMRKRGSAGDTRVLAKLAAVRSGVPSRLASSCKASTG